MVFTQLGLFFFFAVALIVYCGLIKACLSLTAITAACRWKRGRTTEEDVENKGGVTARGEEGAPRGAMFGNTGLTRQPVLSERL